MKRYLTAGDAAPILEVTPATVRDMANRGDLSVAARTESGIRLFDRRVVECVAAERFAAEELGPDEPVAPDA